MNFSPGRVKLVGNSDTDCAFGEIQKCLYHTRYWVMYASVQDRGEGAVGDEP